MQLMRAMRSTRVDGKVEEARLTKGCSSSMPTWPRCASRGRDYLELVVLAGLAGLAGLVGLVVLAVEQMVLAVLTRPIVQQRMGRRRGGQGRGQGMPWWVSVGDEK